ncbi:hypothetical protein EGI16_11990 [Chryseobacterium sp. G0240]|nr:hypothetical protein EGI16_11990 [Chryseobacterium sp. G0240]
MRFFVFKYPSEKSVKTKKTDLNNALIIPYTNKKVQEQKFLDFETFIINIQDLTVFSSIQAEFISTI